MTLIAYKYREGTLKITLRREWNIKIDIKEVNNPEFSISLLIDTARVLLGPSWNTDQGVYC
jgi:hypothetical protein